MTRSSAHFFFPSPLLFQGQRYAELPEIQSTAKIDHVFPFFPLPFSFSPLVAISVASAANGDGAISRSSFLFFFSPFLLYTDTSLVSTRSEAVRFIDGKAFFLFFPFPLSPACLGRPGRCDGFRYLATLKTKSVALFLPSPVAGPFHSYGPGLIKGQGRPGFLHWPDPPPSFFSFPPPSVSIGPTRDIWLASKKATRGSGER